MPNPAKPARLYLRSRRRGQAKVWVILDQGREISTGRSSHDREAAEAKLAQYLGQRTKPNRDSGRDPAQVPIAEILNIYLLDREKSLSQPEQAALRIGNLIRFFGLKPVSALNRRLARDYAESRGKAQQMARRELEDLKAALAHARQEEIITVHPVIELPAKAPPRERWLTRSEAARLIWACWRQRQRLRNGEDGDRATRQHIARFILVGLYTGTRSAAICGAAMGPAIGRGYVDLDQGVFYRRAPETVETTKRQPPVRLPERLLAHMRRWKRRGISLSSVVEYENRPVTEIKKGFRRAVRDADLTGRVTPHTLRHTAITWALMNGVTTWDAADFFGVGHEILQRVYGHHCPSRHEAVGRALTRGHRP